MKNVGWTSFHHVGVLGREFDNRRWLRSFFLAGIALDFRVSPKDAREYPNFYGISLRNFRSVTGGILLIC